MEFVATSINLESEPAIRYVWHEIESKLAEVEGICYYKSPQLKFDPHVIPEIVVITKNHGIHIYKFVFGTAQAIDEFDENRWLMTSGESIYSPELVAEDYRIALENRLIEDNSLRISKRDRRCRIPIFTTLVCPMISDIGRLQQEFDIEIPIIGSDFNRQVLWDTDHLLERLHGDEYAADFIADYESSSEEMWGTVLTRLEGTYSVKRGSKYAATTVPETNGALVQLSNEILFLLDKEQRQIAKQIPNGPQRIRGLAGTGKTVVLSMKAAIMHAQYPDMRVLFTFYTRSMYKQIKTFIEAFYREEGVGDIPDYDDKVHILHSWGAAEQNGIYRELCKMHGQKFFDWTAANRADPDNPFGFACGLLVNAIESGLIVIPEEEKYDLILIDEAQDQPPEFFQLMYLIAKEPYRVIWAYDEFQTLTERGIPGPTELFGLRTDGAPRVSLEGEYPGKIKKDFVLHNSYRNPKGTLMVAHGLGLGLYRDNGIVRMISPEDWENYGYYIEEGRCHPGDPTTIYRPDNNSLNKLEFFYKKYNFGDPKDLVVTIEAPNRAAEIEQVAESIYRDIHEREIAPEEIVIIILDRNRQKDTIRPLQAALALRKIQSITPGWVESPSMFMPKGKVTISSVYRAKGNEANVVYILGADQCIVDGSVGTLASQLILRNSLFTAITRAKGWCIISGTGQRMKTLVTEIERIKACYPRFVFDWPEEAKLERQLKMARLTDHQLAKIQEAYNTLLMHKELLEDEDFRRSITRSEDELF